MSDFESMTKLNPTKMVGADCNFQFRKNLKIHKI